MRARVRLAFAALVLGCVSVASLAADYSAAMRVTVDGWLASQTAEGLFPYGFDFLADSPLEPGRVSPSNLIRQAGSASALAQYYQHTRDARLEEPIRRVIAALGERSLPIGKSRAQDRIERTRILSLPFARWKLRSWLERWGLLYETTGAGKLVSPDATYASALAGTTALSLLTEIRYASASGDNRFAELRAAWLQGLLMLRIPGGGFREKPTSIDSSPFYDGEGWLALAAYADLNRGDAQVASAIADVDSALMDKYSQNPNRGFYHWGAMAAAQRYATTRDARFIAFLQAQASHSLNRFQPGSNPETNKCAAMEGLTATLATLDRSGNGDTALAGQIRRWLSNEHAKLPKLQIKPGQVDLNLAGSAQLHAPRMAEFPGAFLLGLYQPTTRVDAAQHCLSAMTMAERDNLQLSK